MTEAASGPGHYYVPHETHWPIIGSIGLFTLVGGFAMYLSDMPLGMVVSVIGLLLTLYMMYGWFGTVIAESEKGMYHDWEDRSFRMGMGWFIFSEVKIGRAHV